ncbi:MAG TPA: hypothetical protein VF188_14295 [Longimicrobiales bacterium]
MMWPRMFVEIPRRPSRAPTAAPAREVDDMMPHRGDVFWAVDPDESDVPWVVRYTIRPAQG